MNPLQKNLFLVKEHVGMFKAANNFDIYDPESKEIIMTCREPHLGAFTKLFRFTQYKIYTPFNVEIKDNQENLIIRVQRNTSFIRSKVTIYNKDNQPIGYFKQKFFSIGGKFDIFDNQEQKVATLKGKWTGWDFKFLDNNTQELARVTKKWAGLGREMFTSADNYILEIKPSVSKDDPIRKLILAAVMCIDMVLKE